MAQKARPIQRGASVATTGQNRRQLGLLLLIVLMVFVQVCGHEFLEYDDNQNIYQNELITKFTPANLAHFWKRPFAGMYIPLTYNFWSLEAKLASFLPPGQASELNPYLFHTVNLLLHLANASLVFFILQRFIANNWAVFCGALFFAVHPVQVEPVAWVTGGKDLLSTFFSLMALGLYIESAQAQTAGRRPTFRYLLSGLCFLAALLSKPGAVVLPLVVGVIGLSLLHVSRKKVAYDLAPWGLLMLPIIIMTKMVQSDASHDFLPTIWQRLLICGDSLSFYLLKVVLPLHLGPDYGRTPQLVLQQDWIYLTGLLPYVVLAAIIWQARVTYRVAAAIFVVSLLPVLGFVSFTFQSISTVADRYLYLAMLGPALAVAWGMGQCRNKFAWGGSAVILLLLASKSVLQISSWQDTIVFNQQALTVNPRSWTAYGNLGNAKAKQNQQAEAIGHYQRALALKPDDEKTTFNLGVSYGALNQTEAAIAAYHKTLELIAVHEGKEKAYRAELLRDCYLDLGVLYDKSQRQGEAITYYQKAIAADPDYSFSSANLADLFAEIGRKDEAIALYQKALTLAPSVKGIHGSLGMLLMERGNLAAAVDHFTRALAEAPADLAVRLNLGLALYHQQNFAEASRQFMEVVQVEQAPAEASAEAHNGLGAIYLAQGRWQEAGEALQTALRYVPGHQAAKDNFRKLQDEMGNPP